MNRVDVAYLINTTPKYFYLLDLHLTLLERYAGWGKEEGLSWHVFIATEAHEHSTIKSLQEKFPKLSLLHLLPEEESFFESRLVGCRLLPKEIKYVFPIQEDFLLEGRPMWGVIEEACGILDRTSNMRAWDTVNSLRLMPCPGPKGEKSFEDSKWKVLEYNKKTARLETPGKDEYVFTYQATLWRRQAYEEFMAALSQQIDHYPPDKKNDAAIKTNLAEVEMGQRYITDRIGGIHLAWPREGDQPNAVYLAPWPYRPTAVVRGRLMDWAVELGSREKVLATPGPSLR